MKKSLINTTLFVVFFVILISSCRKDVVEIEINLSNKMLADKTWYLEYTQTITATNMSTKTYVGQPTYFINFFENFNTIDSDGLIGTYEVKKINNQLIIQVQAKTVSGYASYYTYNVVSLGDKDMILSSTNGNTETKFYFSTHK